MAKRITLAELNWMQSFKQGSKKEVLTKSALTKGTQIGCFNSDAEIIWIEKTTLVKPVNTI